MGSWVRWCVIACAYASLVALQHFTYLFVNKSMSGIELYSVCSRAVLLCSGIVVIGVPTAAVSETFENDVLRALNDPLVMNRAQRYFGQQMLAHLHTLDWGLRFGGTVINVRLMMNIVMAM